LGLQLLGLFYGYTRSGWLAAGAVVTVWALWAVGRTVRGRIAVAVLGAAVLYIGSQALASDTVATARFNNEASVQSRLATYEQTKALFSDAPVFGVGIQKYTQAAELSIVHPVVAGNPAATTSHNTPINVLVEQGVIGIAGLLLVVLAAFNL